MPDTGKGPASIRWKGGRSVDDHGYVRVWTEGGGYRYEHRLVAEQILGRPLTRDEQVHHRNGDKTDNRPENLMVLGLREHLALHQADPDWKPRVWARGHAACIECGRTTVRHEARGLCVACLRRQQRAA